jgi:hypothetical protein
MRRLVLAAVPFALLAAACQPATTRPDFSGTWRFDPTRSVLQSPSPDSSVFVIDHREPQFHLSRTHFFGADRDTFAIDLTTDGAEVERSYDNFQLRGRGMWDGEVLVFEATLLIEGEQASDLVRYSLAPEGSTLIAEEHFVMGQVSHENKWVFEKRN